MKQMERGQHVVFIINITVYKCLDLLYRRIERAFFETRPLNNQFPVIC